MIDFTPAQLVT